MRCAGLAKPGVKRLEWVSLSSLRSTDFIRDELHMFAAEMVEELSNPSCDVFGRLEDLMDAGQGQASDVPQPESGGPEANQTTVIRDPDMFDVTKALAAAVEAAKPESPQIRPVQAPTTWPALQALMRALPNRDLRKLQLKFHPDRLKRQLRRDPTAAEQKLGTEAMQVLNSATDLVGDVAGAPSPWKETESLMARVSKLRERVEEYARGGVDDDADAPDGEDQAAAVARVAALLEQMRTDI